MKSGDAITIEGDEEVNPLDEVKPFLYSCIPLLAIFFVKFTSQHFNDGLILLGLNLVAMRLNKALLRQVQLKGGSFIDSNSYKVAKFQIEFHFPVINGRS